MYCSKCGSKLEQNSKFCAHCGEKTAEEITTNSGMTNVSYEQQTGKKSSTGLIIGLVVGLLVLVGGAAMVAVLFFGLSITNGLSSPTTENSSITIADQDDVTPTTVSTGDKEVTFGSYSVKLPKEAEIEVGTDSVMFLYDERIYEVSVVTQNFAAIKNSRQGFIGEKQLNGSIIDVRSAELKDRNGQEMVVLKGTLDGYDMVMVYTKSSAVPYYSVAALCYGEDLTEKEAMNNMLPILDSLKIARTIHDSIELVPEDFIETLTDGIIEDETE